MQQVKKTMKFTRHLIEIHKTPGAMNVQMREEWMERKCDNNGNIYENGGICVPSAYKHG